MIKFSSARFWSVSFATLLAIFAIFVVTFWIKEPVIPQPTSAITMTDDQTNRELIASIQALRKEVSALRADLSSLQTHVSNIESKHAPNTGSIMASETIKTISPPQPEPTAEQLKHQHEARLAAIDKDFQSETPELEWATKTSTVIQDVFDSIGSNGNKRADLNGSSLQDLECRASLCKIEVNHIDQKAARNFTRNFLSSVSHDLSRMVPELQQNPDGSFTTRAYMARPGRKFADHPAS